MKNTALEARIADEILALVQSRKTLYLASTNTDGTPYASYAPFAVGDDCLYVLLSEIAVHGGNLQANAQASVLIVEDEDSANEIFARLRVNYRVRAEVLPFESAAWQHGLATLQLRQGKLINHLSTMTDFKLFKLTPEAGRYVKGFGQAYAFSGESLIGTSIDHMRDGHQQRA